MSLPSASTSTSSSSVPSDVFFTLKSKDGVKFEMSPAALRQSETLRTLVDILGTKPGTDDDANMIPIENVDAETLEVVVEWCEHHKNDPTAPQPEKGPTGIVIPEWDAALLVADELHIHHIISAAIYLNIPLLTDYASKTIANRARGKTMEQLSAYFVVKSTKYNDDFDVDH